MSPLLLGLVPLLVTFAPADLPAAPESLAVGHRGFILHAPENTLAGFRACLDLRIGFEVDVQRTRDGTLVCIHDSTVDRTTDGRGRVAALTLAEIQRLDAGAWFAPSFTGERVPTLESVLGLLTGGRGEGVLVAIDLKADDARMAADVVGLARRLGVLDRLVFIGLTITDPDLRKRLRAADPKAHVAHLAETPDQFEAALADPDADWVYVRAIPTPGQSARVKATGKRLFIAGPKVVGQEPTNWKAAQAVGVDAILTDRPLELQATFRQPSR